MFSVPLDASYGTYMSKKRSYLIYVGFVGWFVATVTIASTIRNAQPLADAQNYDEGADPKVGAHLDGIPGLSTVAKGGRYVLLAVSSCSDCTLKSVNPSVISKAAGAPVIAVLDSHDKRGPVGAHESLKGAFATVRLPSAEFAKLNAAWMPRAYLVDSSLRLVAMQSSGESIEQFSRRVQR